MYVDEQKGITAYCYYNVSSLGHCLTEATLWRRDLFWLTVLVGTVPSWWGGYGGGLVSLDGSESRVLLLTPEVDIRCCLQSPPATHSSQLVHSPKGCLQPPSTALPVGDHVFKDLSLHILHTSPIR